MARGLTPSYRLEIFKRDQYTCRSCKKAGQLPWEVTWSGLLGDRRGQGVYRNVLTVDHINPTLKGQQRDAPENLQTLCFSCNSAKGPKSMYNFTLTGALRAAGQPLFYYPEIARALGVKEAIIVGQLIYWSNRTRNGDGWVYKSAEEIETETGLSYREQRRARARLCELRIIEERSAKQEHRIYFRLNPMMLDAVLAETITQADEHLTKRQEAGDETSGEHLTKRQEAGDETSVREPVVTQWLLTEVTQPTNAAERPAAPKVVEGEVVNEAAVALKANEVIREFSDGFERKFGQRPICTAQDAGAAKQLAKRLRGGVPALRRAVDGFFHAGVGWWVEKNAYTFNVFISCYNQAIIGRNGNAGDARERRLHETMNRVLAKRGIPVDEVGE